MTRRRLPTPEERHLWRIAMRDADPMPGRALDPEPEPPPPALDEPVATRLAPPPTAQPRAAAARPGRSLAPLTPGSTANIDRRTSDRFRKGQLVIEGRIDLHGMTQAQAHMALAGFVHHAWNDGRRCVLVITGKGSDKSGLGGGLGVLRQAVPRWLGDPALRPMIVAIQPAQPKDGGDGALYVLIKRRRDRKD
ncbi:DNA mismatch repair protein MutS [Azospirillum cavernae]|jgi:DNA-nicking Smr family endonuclease|uniref:DNA mismatch repair protein MutS n=1 Tax=Azospirillum cavernae TaxID=2320860 RepID=A0A418VWB6_9PROT|nr:Smr/MutS family protein [Azospirillum cavernae]RJF81448.1 DNA mismatch repair protein MutS [Azospirillum cavernae]